MQNERQVQSDQQIQTDHTDLEKVVAVAMLHLL